MECVKRLNPFEFRAGIYWAGFNAFPRGYTVLIPLNSGLVFTANTDTITNTDTIVLIPLNSGLVFTEPWAHASVR